MVASQQGKSSISLVQKLEGVITPTLTPMGYELVDLEIVRQPGGAAAVMRVFIDFLESEASDAHLGIEDCVTVDHGLSRLFETSEFEAIYPGEFTLEVSSPGIDRRLRTTKHFTAHIGKSVKVRTFRALGAEELANSRYAEGNPKQKNFTGTLVDANKELIWLLVGSEEVSIPQSMIAKANLDLANDLLRPANGKTGK